MALKPDREVRVTDSRYTCSVAASPGHILVHTTSGSGVALGDSAGAVTLSASSSGCKVIGMLMHPIVSVDETLYERNWHKGEQKTGERCTLARSGRFTTNYIIGTPTVGATAYLSSSGNLTPTLHATGGTAATPKVGEFTSILDANGYATVEFNLPVV